MNHEKVIDYINELNNNNKKYEEKIKSLTNHITLLEENRDSLTNHITLLEENRDVIDIGEYTEKHEPSKDKFMKIYSKLQLCIKTINNVDIKTIKKEDIMVLYNNFTKDNLIFLYNNFDDYLN